MNLENMDAQELRAEREAWHERVCAAARNYRAAVACGTDSGWEMGAGIELDQALAQVKRIDALLKLGVAA